MERDPGELSEPCQLPQLSFPAWLNIDPSPAIPCRNERCCCQALENLWLYPQGVFNHLQLFLQAALLLNLQVLEGNSIPGAAEGLKCLPPCLGIKPGPGASPALAAAGWGHWGKCSFRTKLTGNVGQSETYLIVHKIIGL